MEYPFFQTVLWSFVGAGVGAYLGAYLKKKGENRAIREDLDNVVTQMKGITHATQDIGAKLSPDMWDRQRRWEIKRDALFAVAKELGGVESALSDLRVICVAVEKEPNNAYMLHRKSQAVHGLSEASSRLDAVRAQAALVCEAEVNTALYAAIILMRNMAQGLYRGDLAMFSNSSKDMLAANARVTGAIRKELGLAADVQAKASATALVSER